MTENSLPPGLVLWPGDGSADHRVGVLISDIHCTDCTVGNQTADETDWESFFHELEEMVEGSTTASSEVLLILNGDVVDLLRSGKWAEANVYPWQRDNPLFSQIVLRIMRDIVKRHAVEPGTNTSLPSSGFFFYLQKTMRNLAQKARRVSLIPILGNHDKELHAVSEAREIFYRDCLGLSQDDLKPEYRRWVSQQMNSDPAVTWPPLPFYLADPSLRLFATHGQWRDSINSHATGFSQFFSKWQPQRWQQEQYRAFSDPCFGDTIAGGLLSGFIWNTTRAIEQTVIPRAADRYQGDDIEHILNVLREMDLYRPPARAVVRLLEEAHKIDRRNETGQLLYQTVVDQYRASLRKWLDDPQTWRLAPLLCRIVLYPISLLSRPHWDRLDTLLMRLMATVSGMTSKPPYSRLPAFLDDYRLLGFRLHAEGHTHAAMETDLHYSPPRERRNYTYVNLGAWRNRIVPKFNKGYRRRSIGRALIVQGGVSSGPESGYGFTLRDITSWGDGLDQW